jgi:hypothetical protein
VHGLDPGFRLAAGPDGFPERPDDDLRLVAGSPCVDAGDSALVPAELGRPQNAIPMLKCAAQSSSLLRGSGLTATSRRRGPIGKR